VPHDALEKEIITVATRVQATAGDGTLRCGTQASNSVGPDFERLKFQGARRRLVATEQPRASSVLEPARPETVGRILRELTSGSTTFKPDERSWDFDGRKLTSARNRTRRSPMLSHGTSPVSGASVMGMTIWVGQGQNHLSADVPEIITTFGHGGRLQLKGRRRQQPAGIFTTGGPSRRRRRKPSNRRFIKGSMDPTRSIEAGDQRDASHAQPPPTATGKPLLHKRIRGR
jgi:hypothetical protein